MAEQIDQRLDIVKRGYDPHQVHRLAANFSAELTAMAAENATLRQQIDQLSAAAAEASRAPADDVISSWSRETNELLEAARQNVARVTEKADADARNVVAAAHDEAAAIRLQAQRDADAAVENATSAAAGEAAETRRQAAEELAASQRKSAETVAAAEARAKETVAGAEAQAKETVAAAESRAAEIVSAAEAYTEELKEKWQRGNVAARANLDQVAAELSQMRSELGDLQDQRRAISEQLRNTQTHIKGLVAMMEEPAAAVERMSDER